MSTTSKAVPDRRHAYAACAALLAWDSALAQFTDFQGGKLYLDMEGNMSPFALGSNTGARGAMNNVTSLYPSSSSLFGNPASLSRLQGMAVQTDFFLPGLGLGVSSERTKLLRNNLRAPIETFLNEGENNVENPVYPDVSLGLYQSTNLGGFSVAFGGKSATLGVGVQQPFRGALDFALGGMRIGLGMPEDENDPASDSIKILISADAFARVSVELNDFSLGVAGEPWKGVHLGIAYQRYTLDMLLEAGARVDGILQRAGQESYFHAADANYHDDLDAKGYGNVTGSAHGVRMGASWQFARHFGLDAMISMAETMFLKGSLGWEYNMLPSLDFGERDHHGSVQNEPHQADAYHAEQDGHPGYAGQPALGRGDFPARQMGKFPRQPGLLVFPPGHDGQLYPDRPFGRVRFLRQGRLPAIASETTRLPWSGARTISTWAWNSNSRSASRFTRSSSNWEASSTRCRRAICSPSPPPTGRKPCLSCPP